MLDLTQKEDAHIDQRLRDNFLIWLGSVRPDGRPHMVAVWFLWTGKEVLIFSKPNNQKIRNLRQNPRVTLALDDTKDGKDVITLDGEAELLNDPAVSATLPAFAEKYKAHLARNGWTAAQMSQVYSQAIRITPTRFYSV